MDFSASGMNEPFQWNFHELSINRIQRYLINNKCTFLLWLVSKFLQHRRHKFFFLWNQEKKNTFIPRCEANLLLVLLYFWSTLTCLRTSSSTFDLYQMNFAFWLNCERLNAIVLRDWVMLMNSDKNLSLSNCDNTMNACVRQQIEQMKCLHCLFLRRTEETVASYLHRNGN